MRKIIYRSIVICTLLIVLTTGCNKQNKLVEGQGYINVDGGKYGIAW